MLSPYGRNFVIQATLVWNLSGQEYRTKVFSTIEHRNQIQHREVFSNRNLSNLGAELQTEMDDRRMVAAYGYTTVYRDEAEATYSDQSDGGVSEHRKAMFE